VLRAPVYEAVQVTPLQKMEKLSSRLDNVILVKREDRQPVHSFKLRGAYAMMAGLTDEQKARGVITASAGNHAQGVAFSSARLGLKALIVMPVATADIKVDAVRGFGGEVLLHGANFDEAKAKAIELAQQQGFTWVPPFDHPMVIAGQGTLALELLQQDAHLDRVFVPVGGGGLAAGVAVLIKQLMPQIKVIAVEAEDSACLKAALDAGHPVDLPRVGLFAEGVAVKRIGDETFRLCQEYLDDIVTVDSDAICAAMKDLFEDVRAVAEPSGALALAGMKKYIAQHNIRGERLAHVLSGANVNFHGLRYVSERCELGEQREALLAVTIPEEKGSFLKFCQLLGGRSVTEFNYRFADAKDACIFVGVRLSRGWKSAKRSSTCCTKAATAWSIFPTTKWRSCTCAIWSAGVRRSRSGTSVQLRVPGIAGRAAQVPAHAGHPLEHLSVPLPQPRHRLWPRAGGVRTGRARAGFRNAAERAGL
jgi:threonine dehydratase